MHMGLQGQGSWWGRPPEAQTAGAGLGGPQVTTFRAAFHASDSSWQNGVRGSSTPEGTWKMN